MRVYHVEFAKFGENISGGERAMIELITFLQKKRILNVLLTTDNGKATYEKLGLYENEFLQYKVISSFRHEQKYHVFISYLLRTRQTLQLIKEISLENDDILFCHSDFFPNFIPFFFLARKNKNTQLFYWFHMLAPSLFKGFEKEYTSSWHFPKLNTIHYKLNQYFYRLSTQERGIILTVNSYYKEILEKKYKNKVYVLRSFGGGKGNYNFSSEKLYDLIWIGRFHEQKNLLGGLRIFKRVHAERPHTTMIILGDGDENIKNEMLSFVEKNNLTSAITYKGFIDNQEKYTYLQKSKVFLMTSFYESFGIVNLEAMSCGLPVVAYDLPTFGPFTQGMVNVPVTDEEGFSSEVLSFLTKEELYQKYSKDAYMLASQYSWEKTGEEIYSLFKNRA